MSRPFWYAEEMLHRCYIPITLGEYGQGDLIVVEIASRIFTHLWALPLLLITLPLKLLSATIIHLVKNSGLNDYTAIKSAAPEKQTRTPKLMHLNACMFQGGLPLTFGGVMPARLRMERLLALIEREKPDLLFLCEINPYDVKVLTTSLETDYPHIFERIGLNPFLQSSGLYVASKLPLVKPPEFHAFETSSATKRGFFALETADNLYIYTHLSANRHADERAVQMEAITTYCEAHPKNPILLGDLNINYHDTDEYEEQIQARGWHLLGERIAENAYTSSNALGTSTGNNTYLDYALAYKTDQIIAKTKLLETHTEPPEVGYSQSLSDHKALVCTLKDPKSM